MSSTTKPWGGIGAWALEAERAEAEERAAAAESAASDTSQSFPSLKEAAAEKQKKKKGTTFPLSVFTTGMHVGPGGGRHQQASAFETKGLTTEELLRLPTGPKERTPEELEYGRLGGGFRNYGSYSGGDGGGGGGVGRREDVDSAWGQGGGRRPYGGGFEEESRRGPMSRGSDFEPSRADEVDNWAAGKKMISSSSMDSGRRDRYPSFGGGSGTTRADEVDNWSMGRKQSAPERERFSGFGSGIRDSSAPSDSDRWSRGGMAVHAHNEDHERPRLVLDPPKKDTGIQPAADAVKSRPSPFGAARPREEILAEKGVDWKKIDSEVEFKKLGHPISAHSSRPSSANSNRGETAAPQTVETEIVVKPRPKVNPFGDAKPREVLLQERGKDWRKIDMELEHRGVDRPETEQERLLKEDIINLKKALNEENDMNLNRESAKISTEELTSIHDQLIAKEKELELLIHELDDKVRFGQKAFTDGRPGSGSGRNSSFFERPPSQSSMPEESRSVDFTDRPGSRGSMGDAWSRTQEDRRGFHTGREGGFLNNRSMDRPKSRERW